tara:strand:+ start:51 stop:2018 length:1968 start_codon:yes stop_codon:yes gene_type:complete
MKQNKKKFNMSVVDLAHYNIPHIGENSTKNYVTFGLDNLYPQYLIELFTGSGINSAIIKGVASMVAGDQQGTMQGLDVVDKDELEGSLKEQYLLLNKLLKRGSRNTIKNLSFDLKLFGSCYINVIWNKTKTAIAEIKHIPAQYIRSGKVNSFGEVTEYHYSFDWANTSQNKPRVIKAFNPDDRTESSQLMQVKEYNPQSFYYGIPDYIGGTDYIRLDMSIAELHLANVDNNFFGSAMISFNNGIPTDEERQEVERKINQKFSGSGNSGKLVITFNDGKETAPEITPLNTGDNDDKYQFLSSEVSRKILTAHRITSPLLFGIKSDGGFGSNNADELRDAYSLLNSIVIKPLQSTLLESLDTLFRINGIVDLSIYFKTLQPADFINLDEVDAIDEQDAGVDIGESSIEMMKKAIEKYEKKKRKENFNGIEVNDDKVCLEYFDDIGITLDEDEWFEAHVETVDNNSIDKNYHEFAYAPAGTPNAISKASDIGMFRLLYRYSQTLSINNKTGKVSSREFCQKMVAKSVAGTLYNLEDLEKASTKSVNKGFGPNGSNTYNIALYCGGSNCRHKWERVWYFRRQVPKGQTFVGDNGEIYTEGEYLPNGTLNNFKLVSQQFANGKVPMPDDKQMRTPSWNQKNHGFIKPRKEKQRSSNTKVG